MKGEKRQNALNRVQICDKVMAFGYYILIFFLPIAPAFVESFFGVIIFSFLIKRIFIFQYKYAQLTHPTKFSDIYNVFIQSFRPVESFLNRPIGIYTLIAFLSIFISYSPLLSAKGFFFKLLQGTYLYFLFIECMNSRKRINIFLIIYLAALMLVIINGAVQYFWGEGFVQHYLKVEGRISSCMKHPNELAIYLVILLPFLLYLNRFFAFTKTNNSRNIFDQKKGTILNVIFQILAGILLLGALFCIGVTYSRGAWIALIFVLVFLYMKNRKQLLLIFFIFALGIMVFTFGMIKERTVNTKGVEGVLTVSGRNAYIASAWEVIKRHPLMGTGLNTYSVTIVNYDVPWKAYPHNCYLHLAAELGAFGLISFLWILVKLYKVSIKQMPMIKDEWIQHILITFLAGLLGFLIHSFFETFFYSTQLGNLFWVILGLIVAVQHLGIKKEPVSFI